MGLNQQTLDSVFLNLPPDVTSIIGEYKSDLEARDHHSKMLRLIDAELGHAFENESNFLVDYLMSQIDMYYEAVRLNQFVDYDEFGPFTDFSFDEMLEMTGAALDNMMDRIFNDGYILYSRTAIERHGNTILTIKAFLRSHGIDLDNPEKRIVGF